MIKIAYVTGHSFGCRALEGIMASDSFLRGSIEISAVVGLPIAFKAQTVGFESPATLAQTLRADYYEATDCNLATVSKELEKYSFDYLLVIGWSRIVPREILEIPKQTIGKSPGAIGIHPTLLPTGRGRAPIPWTILNGLETSGLSVFCLADEVDTGQLIAQYELGIHKRETSTSLFFKFNRLHFEAGLNLADRLFDKQWNLKTQCQEFATNWAKRVPTDSILSETLLFSEAEKLIRAQQWPYPQDSILCNDVLIPVYTIRTIGDNPCAITKDERIIQLQDGPAVVSIK